MSIILEGKTPRQKHAAILAEKLSKLSVKLKLAIIQIGNREDSNLYIQNKKTFASEVGVEIVHAKLEESTTEKELLSLVEKYNVDDNIHGIILQLPIPLTIDKTLVLDSILPTKDVDALGASSTKKLFEGREDAMMPATTRGIMSLLDHYAISMEGKKVTVVGRSTLVGKPTALACLSRNATVTVCHSRTAELAEETRKADILIVAIGNPRFIGQQHVKEGQIVIDVGINSAFAGKLDDETQLLPNLVGDVNYNEVKDIVAACTPVPGGVGQMTVVSLFENLYDLFIRHRS